MKLGTTDNKKYYFKAAELFYQAIERMKYLIEVIERIVRSEEVSLDVQMKQYVLQGEKEHIEYEKDNCLAMYYYMEKDFNEAEKHCINARVHIENAIAEIDKVNFSEMTKGILNSIYFVDNNVYTVGKNM